MNRRLDQEASAALPDGGGRRVVVGMSGGVDSSVAASELIRHGYDVSGLFMKNWDEDDNSEFCTAATDIADAERVCQKLDIELKVINFATEYWDRVFEQFLDELNRGRTPNPDVLCNREIKFREFLQWGETLGAEFIATGHYVRSSTEPTTRLLRGIDTSKDQSYFLYQVPGTALSKSLFPVGHLQKAEVRRRALDLGLDVHAKKDSTGICFIGERRFRDFIKRYVKLEAGPIRDEHGKRIGTHHGLAAYTLGQRQGLGIGGEGAPWYVAAKNTDDNELMVVQGHDHPNLFATSLQAIDTCWVDPERIRLPLSCTAKSRYRQSDVPCRVEAIDRDQVAVQFETPQRALTPGQSIVFYADDECLGGATIDRVTDRKDSASA